MVQHIVIIGNGISGITCARNIRKQSNDAITIISSETEHFYSRTALMYIFMGHMKYAHTKPYEDWFWEKNQINLIKDQVSFIDAKAKKIVLQETASSIKYDKLIIATGSVSNKPAFPGIDLKGVQSLYGMPDLELMNENTKGIKNAVVVGGGLIGIEMAEMLLSKNITVTMLVRESMYWNNVLPNEEATLISNHIREHGVNLQNNSEVKEILGDDNGRVTSVITLAGEVIPCSFVGITVGVSPNISIIPGTEIAIDRGVLVNEYFVTSMPDIYAIGDCVQHTNPPAGRKAVEQVWYTGKIHGETLAQTICGKRTAYKPGHWFNSAKFFDIEYQTYGLINPQPAENENSFYWQHDNGSICFRAVYKKDDETILGFNALGMRLRHNVCDQWLQEKRKIDDVMTDLRQLNFDPEFFDRHEKSILSCFNTQTGKEVKRKRKTAFSFFT